MPVQVVMTSTGEADVLKSVATPDASLKPGEVRIRQQVAGVNFVDIYHRRGWYPVPAFPAVPGVEAVGVIEEVGPDVRDWSVNERVAYVGFLGAYTQSRVMRSEQLVRPPAHLTNDQVGTMLLRGTTTFMILEHVARLQADQTILIHAAAGGLGLFFSTVGKADGRANHWYSRGQAKGSACPELWFGSCHPSKRTGLRRRNASTHGAQKMLGWFGGYGFHGTMDFFTHSLGIPWIFALAAILAEFLGSLALLLGVATRVAAGGIGVVMIVAVLTSHVQNGFFMNWFGNQKGEGFEYHILALGLSAALIIIGGGYASIDEWLGTEISLRGATQ